jgi:hypothetical protein
MGGAAPVAIRRNIGLLWRIAVRLGDTKERAGRGDVVGAIGAGEEPVVADAVSV